MAISPSKINFQQVILVFSAILICSICLTTAADPEIYEADEAGYNTRSTTGEKSVQGRMVGGQARRSLANAPAMAPIRVLREPSPGAAGKSSLLRDDDLLDVNASIGKSARSEGHEEERLSSPEMKRMIQKRSNYLNTAKSMPLSLPVAAGPRRMSSPGMSGYVGDRSKVEQEFTMPLVPEEEGLLEGALIDQRRAALFSTTRNGVRKSLLPDFDNLRDIFRSAETRSSRAILDTSNLLPPVGALLGLQVGNFDNDDLNKK